MSWFVWAKMGIVVLSGSGVLLGHVFRDFSSSLFMYTATISGNYFVLANHSASRDSMSEEIGLEFKLCDFLDACVVAHCLDTLTLQVLDLASRKPEYVHTRIRNTILRTPALDLILIPSLYTP
jgi:hypothetical protein